MQNCYIECDIHLVYTTSWVIIWQYLLITYIYEHVYFNVHLQNFVLGGWDFASNQPIWSSVTWSKVVLNSDSNFPRLSTLNIPCTRSVQSPLSANTYIQFRSLHSANTHSFVLHSRRIRTVSFSTLGEYAQFRSSYSAAARSIYLF